MTVVAVKSEPGDRRDMIDLSTPHPHPTSGVQYGYRWEVYGSQPWPTLYAGDYALMWRTQPSLRKVVDFLARNIAQVRAYLYRRVSDTDRVRIQDHPLARALVNPHPSQTWYRFVEALVTELCIFDRGFALQLPHDTTEMWLRQIPASWAWWDYDPQAVERVLNVRSYGGEQSFPAAQVVELAGYNPNPPHRCPPCETLRQILDEEAAATAYRNDLWRNGARMSGWIERPPGAPEWSDTARERFRREWHGRWSSGSEEAGGTPVLEEGMKFNAATATAEQSQYVEARKLTLAEVAGAYQVPPPMAGLLDNATYSNTREFRQMLYQDTLGPWFAMLQQELQRQVMVDFDDLADCYIEFNVQAKLAGAFEDQAEILSRSVGAPWMTRNEARARQNLPHIDGADELIVPLNVIEGGQQSPAMPLNASAEPTIKFVVPWAVQAVAERALRLDGHDPDGAKVAAELVSGVIDDELAWQLSCWHALHRKSDMSYDLHGGDACQEWCAEVLAPPLAAKARVPDTTRPTQEDELTAKLETYYDRQQRTVTSGLDDHGSLPYAFRYEAQDPALARILSAAGFTFALLGAAAVLSSAEQSLFKASPMAKWLNTHAGRAAHGINVTTYDQLAAIVLGETWRDDVAHVYDVARDGRAAGESRSWATTTTNFGGREAALTGGRQFKTWVTTSRNPRPTHAQLNGTTIAVHEVFGNGAKYPGDPYLPVDERAKCECIMRYS